MPNPNPEQFARVLLWQIVSARFEIASLKAQIDALQHKLGHPPKESAQESIQFERAQALKLYAEICEDIGLTPEPPDEA